MCDGQRPHAVSHAPVKKKQAEACRHTHALHARGNSGRIDETEWSNGAAPSEVAQGFPLPDLKIVQEEQLGDAKLTTLRDKLSPASF